jgi:hypothetical protein
MALAWQVDRGVTAADARIHKRIHKRCETLTRDDPR